MGFDAEVLKTVKARTFRPAGHPTAVGVIIEVSFDLYGAVGNFSKCSPHQYSLLVIRSLRAPWARGELLKFARTSAHIARKGSRADARVSVFRYIPESS